jgi:SAM-dependent methyltransferase
VSQPSSYFDGLYEQAADPWGLGTRWYEERKYQLTLASLPRRRYRRAFEPGCSVGVLTAMLAERCDALIATDLAVGAVSAARRRVAALPHVQVLQQSVPRDWPDGTFDLIVISEIGYFLRPADLATVVRRSVDALDADGTLVAVHWRHHIDGVSLTGDQVHAAIRSDERLEILSQVEERDFLLDVLVRSPMTSVAAAEGIVGTHP